MIAKTVLFLFAIVSSACAIVILPGSCDSYNVSVVQNFNVSRYLGRWYEIERYDNFFQSGDCVTAEYSLYNETVVNVNNTELNITSGNYSGFQAYGYLQNASSGEGKLYVYSENASVSLGSYWVLSTDYDSYSVVWSCSNLTTTSSIQFLWLLSRNTTLSSNASILVNETLNTYNLNQTLLQTTIQNSTVCQRGRNSGTTISLSIMSMITCVLLTLNYINKRDSLSI